MVRRDLPEVLAIEQACYKKPWTEAEFVNRLKGKGTIGMSLRSEDGAVNGFMVYANGDRATLDLGDKAALDRITLVSLAVKPELHRQGLGSLMLDKLKYKAACGRRKEIVTLVHEGNLSAHLWLKANGFFCFKVGRKVYANGADGLWFRYDL